MSRIKLKLPKIELSKIKLPRIKLSKIKLKKVKLSKTKLLKTIKKSTKEIIIGVIIGALVALLTLTFNSWNSSVKKQKDVKFNLSKITIGISKDYVDSLFGYPIVNDKSKKVAKRNYESNTTEDINCIFAGYKLKNSVLLCLFDCDSETLFAYVIVVNSKNEYYVSAHLLKQTEANLLDFTYHDFSDEPVISCGNDPPLSDDWAFYCELYDGSRFTDYNAYIIGEYKVHYYISLSDYGLFYPITRSIDMNKIMIDSTIEKYQELRSTYYPNMFGMIESKYIDDFDFFYFIGTNAQCGLLFDDWFDDDFFVAGPTIEKNSSQEENN